MCCSVAILKPTHVIPQTVLYPLSPCIYINNSYICQYSFICNSIVPFLDFILLFVYPRISSVCLEMFIVEILNISHTYIHYSSCAAGKKMYFNLVFFVLHFLAQST